MGYTRKNIDICFNDLPKQQTNQQINFGGSHEEFLRFPIPFIAKLIEEPVNLNLSLNSYYEEFVELKEIHILLIFCGHQSFDIFPM